MTTRRAGVSHGSVPCRALRDMADLELVLLMLCRMQGDLRDIKDTQREHTPRLGRIELNTAQQNVADAEQSTRIDRFAERIERIGTRLDLRE